MESGASAAGAPQMEPIDWEKVGKIYKPESAIEDILSREMNRLQNALDQKMDIQEKDLETKHATAKKKWVNLIGKCNHKLTNFVF